MQHTGEFDRNAVTLRIYPGSDGRFTWYDDDGESYRHESGEFVQMECVWNDVRRTLTLTADPSCRMALPSAVKVELAGGSPPRRIALTSSSTTVKL